MKKLLWALMVAVAACGRAAPAGEKDDCQVLLEAAKVRLEVLEETRAELMTTLNGARAYRDSLTVFLPMIPGAQRAVAYDYDSKAERKLMFAQYGFGNRLYVQAPLDAVISDSRFAVAVAENHYAVKRYRHATDELKWAMARMDAGDITAFDIWFNLENAEWYLDSVTFIISMTTLNPRTTPTTPVAVPTTVSGSTPMTSWPTSGSLVP